MSAPARTTPWLFVGDDDMYGYPDPYVSQYSFDMGPEVPTDFRPAIRFVATGRGNPTVGNQNPPQYIGIETAHFHFRDRDDVTPETKGVGYAGSFSVSLMTPRGGDVPWADACCITFMNRSGAVNRGTDMLYGAHNALFGTSPEFGTLLSMDTNANRGLAFGGTLGDVGLELSTASIPSNDAIRLGNKQAIRAKFTSGVQVNVANVDEYGDLNLGDTIMRRVNAKGPLSARAWFGRTPPVVCNAATYTVTDGDNYIIFGGAGCTVTLPAGARYIGRELTLKKTMAAAIAADAAIIVPLGGVPLVATLLGGGAGQWVKIVMDGAGYWQTMEGGG